MNDQILVLFEDSHHRFWDGTEGGLNLFQFNTCESIDSGLSFFNKI